jgi:SAM-dependent methyltransferase
MNAVDTTPLREKILEENRRVHALENAQYLDRHPEQTHFFQKQILYQSLHHLGELIDAPGAQILDVGCGTGYLCLPLLKAGYQMTGVDLSQDLVNVLDTRIPENARSRSRLVVQDIFQFLEKEDTLYDAVVVSALLHHLFDYETVVRALCDSLKPGGLLMIFFEPLKQEINSPLRFQLHRALGQVDEFLYQREMRRRGIALFEEAYELADYQRQFGGIEPARIEKILENGNLEKVELKTYCARRNGWCAWLANRVLKTENTFNLIARKHR